MLRRRLMRLLRKLLWVMLRMLRVLRVLRVLLRRPSPLRLLRRGSELIVPAGGRHARRRSVWRRSTRALPRCRTARVAATGTRVVRSTHRHRRRHQRHPARCSTGSTTTTVAVLRMTGGGRPSRRWNAAPHGYVRRRRACWKWPLSVEGGRWLRRGRCSGRSG